MDRLEQARIYQKRYYLRNRDKCNARVSAYRKKNKDKFRVISKKYRERHPEKVRASARKSYYKIKYGLTIQEKEAMLASQANTCPICLSGVTLSDSVIDHCHDSGKVREVLCGQCNSALGFLQDSSAIAKSAMQYLEKHSK